MPRTPHEPSETDITCEVDLREPVDAPRSEAPAEIKERGRVATYYALARVKFEYLIREAAKFGVVGVFALVIDVGLFNLLMYVDPVAVFAGKPLTAKVVAVAVAMTFAYFANRFWTFRDRGRTSMAREYILFVVLNLAGMGIALACLWFSHYALGLTSALADNISANVVGLILGTLFRFWSYRKWVFPAVEDEEAVEPVESEVKN